MRSSSTRPSSTAVAARPAPPIETSLSVASSAAAASSASDASASRALPWTLSDLPPPSSPQHRAAARALHEKEYPVPALLAKMRQRSDARALSARTASG
jgi:hypothetical protein